MDIKALPPPSNGWLLFGYAIENCRPLSPWCQLGYSTTCKLVLMGRTTPTATQNLHYEMAEWKAFRNKLPKQDRKLFDEMLLSSKLHTMSMMASIPRHPVRIQPIMMSIVFEHYKQLAIIMKKVGED